MDAKELKSLYYKQWRKKNAERLNASQREWRKRNPEKVREYNNRYWTKKVQELEQAQASIHN